VNDVWQIEEHPMTLGELAEQCQEDVERWFPDYAWNLPHQALGLCGEAGELANMVKKAQRGTVSFAELRDAMAKEAIDVLVYLFSIFAILEMDEPEEEYARVRAANESRFGGRVPASAE
jgi:NTP pyrophosphatase (non-canonical NTP hydrolase)